MSTTKPKTRRLSKTETAARDFMAEVRDGRYGPSVGLAVVWRKSRTWGSCPTLETLGGTVLARASGCGYDKESTVLADGLRFLAVKPEEHAEVWKTGGCGVQDTIRALAACGWNLTKTHNGRTEDGWKIERNN